MRKATIGAMTSAPITLNNFHYDLTFRHLGMEALESLSADMRKLNTDVAAAPAERMARLRAQRQVHRSAPAQAPASC